LGVSSTRSSQLKIRCVRIGTAPDAEDKSPNRASVRPRLCLARGHAGDVVVYVRRPSEHYLASVQQLLKASHKIPGPNPIEYRPAIEGYATHVADRMHVVKYDPSNWADGDIVRQFLATFVPELDIGNVGPARRVNRSLSAEAMTVLAEYRSRIWPDGHNRFTSDTNRVVNALDACDIEVAGGRAPHLHDHVARMVDQASTDLLWLRDEHAITFDGIDYSDIRPAADRHRPVPGVDSICPVDVGRRDELMWQVMYHLAQDEVASQTPEIASSEDPAIPSTRRFARRIAGLVRRHRRHSTGTSG